VTIVPEGLEPALAAPSPARETRPTIVFCGRMVPYKRPADVVEAVRIAQSRLPGLQAWMIGGGPDLERLRSRAPEGVVYFGRVDEATKIRLMSRAHAHVATSIREGWGLVVSEAAALGTRTIAYDTPGLRDSTTAAGGVLVPPTPAALADWLVALLPRWQEEAPEPLPHGGAHSWDDVAAHVLAAIEAHAVVPTGSARRLAPRAGASTAAAGAAPVRPGARRAS
jgi:glycosyltransferase involved in cell wall biosynthesis